MVSEKQRQDIIYLVEVERQRLGSDAKVATKCGVSPSLLSQLKSNTYTAQGDDAWFKVGNALGYVFNEQAWRIVDVANMRLVYNTLQTAKERALFVGISDYAGSGKSTATKAFEDANKQTSVFRLACKEWSRKAFLDKLMALFGLDITRYMSAEEKADLITDFIRSRVNWKPLLILDEADKLKHPALRLLIPLYNDCEGQLGVVICGTEHLEKDFARGVKHSWKGYDELSSRFGRRFIHLQGCTEGDVASICSANGVTAKASIKSIFEQCSPVSSILGNTQVRLVKDLRRLRRSIEAELLRMAKQQPMEAVAA
jgi:AAA domain